MNWTTKHIVTLGEGEGYMPLGELEITETPDGKFAWRGVDYMAWRADSAEGVCDTLQEAKTEAETWWKIHGR